MNSAITKSGRKKTVYEVLELCCFEWFQNEKELLKGKTEVLELCCFEWFQNKQGDRTVNATVLELCCFEWFQNTKRAN